MYFDYPPTVDVLDSLIKEPLYKGDNLSKAIRIWGVLRTLYGNPTNSWRLNPKQKEDRTKTRPLNSFTYSEWHYEFYQPNLPNHLKIENVHPASSDEVPQCPDPGCICTKTIKDLLFYDSSSKIEVEETKWCEDLRDKYKNADLTDCKITVLFDGKKKISYPSIEKCRNFLKKQLKKQNVTLSKDIFDSFLKYTKKELVKNSNLTNIESIIKVIQQNFPSINQSIIKQTIDYILEHKYEYNSNRPFLNRKPLADIFGSAEGLSKNNKWIIKQDIYYQRLSNCPQLDIRRQESKTSEDLQSFREDLADIVLLTEPINGVFRVYFNLEYVNTEKHQGKVGDLLYELTNNIWNNDPVPLLKMTYNSAILGKQIIRTIYPISSYYNRRASYLCTYGQGFKNKQSLEYRNYRLDRIQNLEILQGKHAVIPDALKLQNFKSKNREYSPEYINEELDKALGFDFYLPIKTMLISFPPDFHEGYIEGTFRHDTFNLIKKRDFSKLFKKLGLTDREKTALNKRINDFPDDFYYTLDYRAKENSSLACNDVLMRLRQWADNIKVLFPGELRHQRIQEASRIYQNHQ